MSLPALELRSVVKLFGSLTAVDGVSLSVPAGERHAILGPNGAGKTTLFDVIAGATEPDEGRIHHRGVDVTGRSEAARARRGIVRSFQLVELFEDLPVRQNLALAVQASRQSFDPVGRLERAVYDRADDWCDRLDLDADRLDPVETLSHGDRKRLEVGTALATDADTLLLDEPTSGVPGTAADALLETIDDATTDRTVLLIEHDVDAALEFADRVTVMDSGRVIATGSPSAIVDDDAVQQAYIGRDDDTTHE